MPHKTEHAPEVLARSVSLYARESLKSFSFQIVQHLTKILLRCFFLGGGALCSYNIW